jgi:hypothetical protein
MENKESLEATAVIGKTPNLIKNDVDLLFANGIMTPRIYRPFKILSFREQSKWVLTVTCGVLLPSDHRLWVEEFAVLACSNFVYDIWFEVDVKRTRYVFPR